MKGDAGVSRPAKAVRAVLDLAGVALLATGLWALVHVHLRWPIDPFDEGVLLTDSMLVAKGLAPYRDFYSNYPPGIFLLIAGLWKLFGVTPMVLRGLGLAIHVGLALVAGRLAGRAGGRRFSWLGAGLAMAWLCYLRDVPFAWLAALLAALVFVERLGGTPETASRSRWIAAGLALGVVGCFRHDLFVYFGIALALLGLGWAAWSRRLRTPPRVAAAALSGLVAAAILLGLVWIPTLARAGFGQAAADLYLDQVRYVVPGRALPLPDLSRPLTALGGVVLPALACRPFEGAVALTFAGPALGLVLLLVVRRRERLWDPTVLLLEALACAVAPQMLGRTDLWHALFTVTPALVLGAALAERATAEPRGRLAVVAGFGLAAAMALPVIPQLGSLAGLRPPYPAPGSSSRYGGLPEESAKLNTARRQVFAFLDAHGRAGDAVFVGCLDHRFPIVSEMDLYFLADRVGATRYMQFDPGIVARREVQEEMIRGLEEKRPAVAVLSSRTLAGEPARRPGPRATLLDEYLRLRYRPVGTAGPYVLLVRR